MGRKVNSRPIGALARSNALKSSISLSLLVAVFVFGTCLSGFAAAPQSAADEFAFAAGLHDRGLHDRAIRAFDKFLGDRPRDPRVAKAHFYLGQSLAEIGQDARALTCFEKYLASGEDELKGRALLRAGELLQRTGKAKRAMRRLLALIKSSRDAELLEPAHYFLGEAAAAAGDVERSKEAFSDLLETWPRSQYVPWSRLALGYFHFQAQEFKAALRQFRKLRKAKGTPKELAIEARIMVAESLFEMKEFSLASEGFASLRSEVKGRFSAQASLGFARSTLGEGKIERAVAAFEDHAKTFGDDPRLTRALIRAAASLHEMDRGQEGLSLVLLVRDAKGQDAEDLAFWSGRLLDANGDTKAALRELETAAKKSPRRKFSYGDALSRAGKFDAAAKVFAQVRRETKDEALRRESAFAEAYALNRSERYEPAIKVLTPWVGKRLPADLQRDVLFALGENYFALKRFEEAESWFQQILELDDGKYRLESLYKKGWCAWSTKRPKTSREAFQSLVAADPQGPYSEEAQYLIAKCYEAEGQHEKARRSFEKVKTEGGSTSKGGASELGVKARMGEAAALRRSGEHAAAAAVLERAFDNSKSQSLRGTMLADLGQARSAAGDAAGAVESWDLMLRSHGDHPRLREVRLARAWALRDLGKQSEAADSAVELANEESDAKRKGEAQYLAGLTYQEAGAFESAVEPLKNLMAGPSHPRQAEARLLLGVCLARAGHSEEAIAYLVAAAKDRGLASRDTLLYELAFCCEKTGDAKGRTGALTSLVEDHPESRLVPDAAFRLGEAAYAEDDFKAALTHYQRAFGHEAVGDLKDKVAYKGAWCLKQLDLHERAAQAFDLVADLEKSPLSVEALYLAAESLEKMGSFEPAAERFGRMVKDHPRHEYSADAACRQVLCYASGGRHKKVIRRAPGVLEKHSGRPQAVRIWSALGDALRQTDKPSRARVAYRKVIGQSEGPLAARAQYHIAHCWQDEGKADRAIDELLKVAILYAHRDWAAKATYEAAELLAADGQLEKARKLRADLVRDYPNSAEAKKIQG